MTPSPLRVGIAGLGTVGGGAFKILTEQAAMLEARAGRKIEVVGVCARNRSKRRGIDLRGVRWFDDALGLVASIDVDLVVEAIGGAESIARNVVEKALSMEKPVVTANKALVAHHGFRLATLAEKHDTVLAFEAAVAGGIPIIKSLREGLAANRISSVSGILNATCNVILTTMQARDQDLPLVLKEAERLGLLEADPSIDIDGYDAAHKIAILSALAFGGKTNMDAVMREGIRRITIRDIRYAATLGYTVKLLATAVRVGKGVAQCVHPCLVPKDSYMAQVSGPMNAVRVVGDAVGEVIFQGAGGGEMPTASAVVADIVDIARGAHYRPFTLPAGKLKEFPAVPFSESERCYYLRIPVADEVGVLASVTALLKRQQVSVSTFLQEPHPDRPWAELVLTTHKTREAAMQKAVAAIAKLESVKEPPYMIRIEEI